MSSLWHNSNGRTGCVLVGLVLLAAIAGAIGITPYPAQAQDPTAVLKSPSFSHPVGHGPVRARPFLAGPAGPVHIGQDRLRGRGHRRGHRDRGRDRGRLPRALDGQRHHAATDMLFAIPAILFALAIVTALGPGWLNSALAIGIGYIPIFVRVVRGPVLALREAGYVRAAACSGLPPPPALPPHIAQRGRDLAVQTSLALAWSVLAEASLSFLGLGAPAPTASLGEMVSQSSSLAGTAWWTLAAPSVAHRHSRYRLQFPRRRPAGRHRPRARVAKKLRS